MHHNAIVTTLSLKFSWLQPHLPAFDEMGVGLRYSYQPMSIYPPRYQPVTPGRIHNYSTAQLHVPLITANPITFGNTPLSSTHPSNRNSRDYNTRDHTTIDHISKEYIHNITTPTKMSAFRRGLNRQNGNLPPHTIYQKVGIINKPTGRVPLFQQSLLHPVHMSVSHPQAQDIKGYFPQTKSSRSLKYENPNSIDRRDFSNDDDISIYMQNLKESERLLNEIHQLIPRNPHPHHQQSFQKISYPQQTFYSPSTPLATSSALHQPQTLFYQSDPKPIATSFPLPHNTQKSLPIDQFKHVLYGNEPPVEPIEEDILHEDSREFLMHPTNQLDPIQQYNYNNYNINVQEAEHIPRQLLQFQQEQEQFSHAHQSRVHTATDDMFSERREEESQYIRSWEVSGDHKREGSRRDSKHSSFQMQVNGVSLLSYFDLHQRLLKDKDELAKKYQDSFGLGLSMG